MNNLTINKMRFAKKNNDANKFVTSINPMNHQIRCTMDDCGNIQDLDNMGLLEAKNSAYEAGWRKGTDSDAVVHCCCPECVEANEVYKRDDKHYTEMNSYGE